MQNRVNLVSASETLRHKYFRRNWTVSPEGFPVFVSGGDAAEIDIAKELDSFEKETEENEEESEVIDVGFSYHSADALAARFLRALLRKRRPNLRTNWFSANINMKESSPSVTKEARQLATLERAQIIVPLLSLSYLTSEQCKAQLYLALCRRRSAQVPLCPVALSALGQQPSVAHLLPVRCHVLDDVWYSITGDWSYGDILRSSGRTTGGRPRFSTAEVQ